MELINRKSKLWKYLPEEIRGLIDDGEYMLGACQSLSGKVSDYSFLVFPFSKAFEGFLKQIFLDMGLIREEEFYGDDIRIGRILNPLFMDKKDSVYAKLMAHSHEGKQVAERLWKIWKAGRNQVFHFFPHNFRRLSEHEAEEIIREIVGSMEAAINILNKNN